VFRIVKRVFGFDKVKASDIGDRKPRNIELRSPPPSNQAPARGRPNVVQ
jgi:hypothetical protein